MYSIIVANGQFPSHPTPLSMLSADNRIIATDGSYQTLLDKGIVADYWLGDMDSHNVTPHPKTQVIVTPDQERTDLAKTLQWCLSNEHTDIILLGATGLRDDHHLANLFLLLNWHEKFNLTLVSDTHTIMIINGIKKLSTYPGQTISLISPTPDAIVSTDGLQYPLSQAKLSCSTQGVSNIALVDLITIESNTPIWCMFEHQ